MHVYIPAIYKNQSHEKPCECQTIEIIQVHVYIPAVYKNRLTKTKWISNYWNNTGACSHPWSANTPWEKKNEKIRNKL